MRTAARRRFYELRDGVRQLGLLGAIRTFEGRGPRFTLRRRPVECTTNRAEQLPASPAHLRSLSVSWLFYSSRLN